MNYLQLVNAVKTNAGVAGPAITDVKLNTPHINKLICDWVRDAWVEIQSDPRLRPSFNYVTNRRFVLSPRIFPHEYSYKDFQLSDGVEFDFETFAYKTDLINQKQPIPLTKASLGEVEIKVPVKKEPKFVVATSPNSFYLVPTNKEKLFLYFNYWKPPQILRENDDRPEGLLEQHHPVIVYKALVSYSIYDAAPEILQYAELKYQEYMKSLYHHYTVNTYPKRIKFNRFV